MANRCTSIGTRLWIDPVLPGFRRGAGTPELTYHLLPAIKSVPSLRLCHAPPQPAFGPVITTGSVILYAAGCCLISGNRACHVPLTFSSFDSASSLKAVCSGRETFLAFKVAMICFSVTNDLLASITTLL